MRLTQLGAIPILVLSLVLGSCGGDGDDNGNGAGAGGSEADSFVDSVNQYCSDFEKLADLGDKLLESSDLQAAADATRQYAQKGGQVANDLSQLDPPAGTETAWNRFVDALRTSAKTQGDVVEAYESGDIQRVRELGPQLPQNQARFIAAGRGLLDAGIAPDCLIS